MTRRDAIDREREAMRARGFLGEPVPGGAPTYTDGPHSLTVRLYHYPDCADPRPFVEAWESHDGAREARIYPLSEVVHLLQNVSEREFYVLGGREVQPQSRGICVSEDPMVNEVSGPTQSDDNGGVFIDVNGRPVLMSRDSVLSAKPNTSALNEAGMPSVVLVWLKGHNRHVAVRSTWSEFEAWRFGYAIGSTEAG